MKLDFDFLIKILTAVEDHPESKMLQIDLLSALGISKFKENEESERQRDKFYYHMMRISEIGCLETAQEGFGFETDSAGRPFPMAGNYELTMVGHAFLDASRDKTLWEETKKWFGRLSVEEFKSRFPALLIEILRNFTS